VAAPADLGPWRGFATVFPPTIHPATPCTDDIPSAQPRLVLAMPLHDLDSNARAGACRAD